MAPSCALDGYFRTNLAGCYQEALVRYSNETINVFCSSPLPSHSSQGGRKSMKDFDGGEIKLFVAKSQETGPRRNPPRGCTNSKTRWAPVSNNVHVRTYDSIIIMFFMGFFFYYNYYFMVGPCAILQYSNVRLFCTHYRARL